MSAKDTDGTLTLFRKSTLSLLEIRFSDVGVYYEMSLGAIRAHVNSFYYGWEPIEMRLGNDIRVFTSAKSGL